jgi:hypothetical protein
MVREVLIFEKIRYFNFNLLKILKINRVGTSVFFEPWWVLAFENVPVLGRAKPRCTRRAFVLFVYLMTSHLWPVRAFVCLFIY